MKKDRIKALLFFFILISLHGCGQKSTKKQETQKIEPPMVMENSPFAYDLSHPEVYNLSADLNEISGIVYYPKDGTIFAIQDEGAYLYKINLKNTKEIDQWEFAGKSDYEDVTLWNDKLFILQSNGDIYSLNVPSGKSIKTDQYKFDPNNKHEFESLYFDDKLGKIVMICKEWKGEVKSSPPVWGFDPQTKSFVPDLFTINGKMLEEKTGEKIHFKPSAAAIHPVTNELYIVSAVNNLLVIADRKGNVIATHSLDPSMFKQPEGITFLPSGDMLISNESAQKGSANILLFHYK